MQQNIPLKALVKVTLQKFEGDTLISSEEVEMEMSPEEAAQWQSQMQG